MSQHPDINDHINGANNSTTDEQTSNNTMNPATQATTDTATSMDTDASSQADPTEGKHIRIVNTFMKRRTHMNKNAELALTAPEFAHYLINNSFGDGNLNGIDDLRVLFADSPNGSDAPLTVEIGFGLGDSFIEMAAAEPTRNFVGVEVHEPVSANALIWQVRKV